MLTVLCTNDFCSQLDPTPTSYGRLPGANGVIRTIQRLKALGPSVWIDAGDLVTGPLSTVSDGTIGFEAAATLPIDLAVPGNHEFDWGLEHYKKHVRQLPYPSLCGNVDADLPATAILETPAGRLGVIGLTCPDLGRIHTVGNSISQENLADRVREWATELRRNGARWIVLVLHDGIDLIPSPGGVPSAFGAPGIDVDTRRLYGVVKPWLTHIDGLICGHTLIRWFGDFDGVPVAQPLVYGAEIGVITLKEDGPGMAYGIPVEPAGHWEGPGSELIRELSARPIGTLKSPLAMHANHESPLLQAIGRSLLAATDADAALTTIWDVYVRQPLVGGVMSYLPGGAFSELDLINALPVPDDAIGLVELTAKELEHLPVLASLPHMVARGVVLREGVKSSPEAVLKVALRDNLVDRISGWLGRPLKSETTGLRLREVVGEHIRSGTFGAE